MRFSESQESLLSIGRASAFYVKMRFSESQESILSIGRASAFYVKMRFSESQESLLSIGQASAFYVKSLGALPNGRCKVTTFFRKIQIKIKTY